MARLPDPAESLEGSDREAFEHMASARSRSSGRKKLGEVYVRMFNNPALAIKVGAVGEHLRFHGVLPDDVRELAILRFSSREGYGYEWSHHLRPAHLAGIDQDTIDAITVGEIPAELAQTTRAVLQAVDAIAEKRSIPETEQQLIVDKFGTAGAVEVVALCGLYAMMGYMVTAFDIDTEAAFPGAPF